MSFFQKLRYKLSAFMMGRYGADQLGLAMIYGSLFLTLLGAITRLGLFTIIAEVIMLLALLRMLSKNRLRRSEENAKFWNLVEPRIVKIRQAWVRLRNRKQYRYVRCPGCKSYLKLPRGTGEVTMTCGKCHVKFKTHG